ncbi:DNA-binding protein [Flavonifractor sp. An82]|uniref:DNA-binding protein n=1 Tax=Flavonifractor sp. An82 TaxID=1965660 RepID=UPI000B3912FA|nr:DNA-binding protein [Flavonifractor sp. An82]OUN20251.1 DNA-binding protein [Flavonifractor sp. An82]
MVNTKKSVYKNHTEARALGVSPSSGYELMHQPDFTVLRVGNCMVVPKEKYIQWMAEHTGGVI